MGTGIGGVYTRNLWLVLPEGHFLRLPFWLMREGGLLRVVVLCCLHKKMLMLLENYQDEAEMQSG